MNSRTHQISLSYTDSENVVLQQETETTHVAKLELLLYSQPVRLGLPIEPGVEHLADILADARALACDAFEVLPLLHRAHFFSGCPVRRLRHCSSQSIK